VEGTWVAAYCEDVVEDDDDGARVTEDDEEVLVDRERLPSDEDGKLSEDVISIFQACD
jgi:hypothetical protein